MAKTDRQDEIIEKAWKDEQFRKELLADPNGAVERVTGQRLPEGIKVKVVEEGPDEVCLVLPARQRPGDPVTSRELFGGTMSTCSTQYTCARHC
jgi:hypothetical protein